MIRKLFVMLAIGLMAGTALASWPYTDESYTFYVSMSSDEFQRQITDVNSQINRILSQYNISGAGIFSPYRLVAPNRAVATVYSSVHRTTFTVTVINNGVSTGPSSSPTIVASRTLRNSILAPAAPGQDPQERPRSVRHTGLRADIFYNSWEDDAADTKGAVVGINPTIMFGGRTVEFGVTIPIHASIPDTETDEDPTYHLGVDFSLRVWLGNYVSLGMHALYLADMYTVKGGDANATDTLETRSTVNGGPFVSARIPFGKVGVLSFAGLLENSYDLDAEDAEVVSEVALAANMGFNLGEVAALNIFSIYHMNLDSELENSDYGEGGVEAQFGGGDTWSFSFGVKTVVGIKDYSSIEGYIGSQWRW